MRDPPAIIAQEWGRDGLKDEASLEPSWTRWCPVAEGDGAREQVHEGERPPAQFWTVTLWLHKDSWEKVVWQTHTCDAKMIHVAAEYLMYAIILPPPDPQKSSSAEMRTS